MQSTNKHRISHRAKTYLPRTWVDPRVVVGPSSIEGKGLFASEDIKKGETIMIWGGIKFPKSSYNPNQYREMTVVSIDEDNYFGLPISDTDESLDEYLNHSCDPSAWLIDEVTVVARRDIHIGEEITVDMATWDDDEEEPYADDGKCTCRSSLCRKVLSSKDWMIPELQERYAGHFSPYLNRRISKLRTNL